MDFKFWVALLVNVIGLGLTIWNLRMMIQQASPRARAPRRTWWRAYWPIPAMAILMVGCWVPYLAVGGDRALPAGLPVRLQLFHEWGSTPSSVWANVNSAQLAGIRQSHDILLVCRLAEHTVETKRDASIERSGAFSITGGLVRIEIPVSRALMARMVPGRVVEIYALIVPKGARVQTTKTLEGLESLGARVVDVCAYGV